MLVSIMLVSNNTVRHQEGQRDRFRAGLKTPLAGHVPATVPATVLATVLATWNVLATGIVGLARSGSRRKCSLDSRESA